MKLYKNEQEFRDAVIAAAEYFHINPEIVEKDYYVTLMLKNLNERIPGIVFKGGTGLSKCFKVINRFSEDIDLTLDTCHFTQSNKRKANKHIILVCDELGWTIQNRAAVAKHSHGSYNCYNIEYPVSFGKMGIRPFIKVEMTFIQKSFPDTIKPVCSLIGEYLSVIGRDDLLQNYELLPYNMRVQSMERTFVDKVFALCDYYLRDDELRQSRHIYDIFKLMDAIDWKNLASLINDVRQERIKNKTCLSAQTGVQISQILNNIIETAFFKKDYLNVTTALLNEQVDYESAILSLRQIATSHLFDDKGETNEIK